MKTKQRNRYFFPTFTAKACLAIFLACLLAACASTPESESQKQPAPAAETSAQPAASETAAAAPTASPAGDASGTAAAQQSAVADMIQAQAAQDAQQTSESLPDITEAPQIVQECQKEDYVKQEQQARASIKKGKEAMEAGRYGVGFKNAEEYKKWSGMHNTVFSGVSQACAKLSECAKQHAKDKDKDKQCAEQAQTYADWKHTAKLFTVKVKSVESTQPPQLCSSPLAMDDPPYCYEQLAGKIDKVCESDDCKEASQCWRSVTILDGAINQEESACRFSRIKLSECRGYIEASRRRKDEFERCKYLQNRADVVVAPVL